MPDLRYDPVNDHWVAVAENRIRRPSEFEQTARPIPLALCPFCGGNEGETPPALAQYSFQAARPSATSPASATGRTKTGGGVQRAGRLPLKSRPAKEGGGGRLRRLPDQEQTGWMTRVIPNRFPAFGPQAAGIASDLWEEVPDSPYCQSGSPASCQELIIESPRHVEGYTDLEAAELELAFLVYRERLVELRRVESLKFAMLFKNCRFEAGASLSHVHSQLIALDFVPALVAAKARRMDLATDDGSGVGLLRRITDFEERVGVRLVSRSRNWLAFCPFASRFNFQTWVVPRRLGVPYWAQPAGALRELAHVVRELVVALEQSLNGPAYNVLFHNPPFDRQDQQGHFYIELFARMGNAAGFEWGTDCWINPVSPESAARQLRSRLRGSPNAVG